MISLNELYHTNNKLRNWFTFRLLCDGILFYVQILLQFGIGVFGCMSSYLIYANKLEAVYLVNSCVTLSAISIGVLSKIRNYNKESMTAEGKQRIEVLESLCEIECINNPEQEFILRKSLEAQIEVINIQTKLIQKRSSTVSNLRNQSSDQNNISIDQTDRTPTARNDNDGKQNL